MKNWYQNYWSQAWYKRSYLVNAHEEIGRATVNDKEWNNIDESGCNFTCLAMIVGIDPAYLTTTLLGKDFFLPDASLPATYLNRSKGGLVWDRNRPCKPGASVTTNPFWHPGRQQRVEATISFHGIVTKTRDLAEARRAIESIRAAGRHVIFGPTSHSHLVAGVAHDDYFVWDPDDEDQDWSGKCIPKGELSLADVFAAYPDRRMKFEFWDYGVTFKNL